MTPLLYAMGQNYLLVPVLTDYTRYPAGISTNPHLHRVYHIVFILQGSGTLGHGRGATAMCAGDIIIVDPGEKHIFTGGRAAVENFAFNFALLPVGREGVTAKSMSAAAAGGFAIGRKAEIAPFTKVFGVDVADHHLVPGTGAASWDSILAYIRDFHGRVAQADGGSERIAEFHRYQYCATLFLQQLLLMLRPEEFSPGGRNRLGNDLLAQETARFLHSTVHEKYDLGRMAAKLGYAPAYVCTHFRRVSGMTPGAYSNRIKSGKACIYLTESSMGLSQMALELGFSSVQHFCGVFRKTKGVSPGRFRRQAVLL